MDLAEKKWVSEMTLAVEMGEWALTLSRGEKWDHHQLEGGVEEGGAIKKPSFL